MKTRYTQLFLNNYVQELFDLESEEVFLLNYIIHYINSKKVLHEEHSLYNEVFFWIHYPTLVENAGKNTKCNNTKTLSRRFNNLLKKNWNGQPFLKKITINSSNKDFKKAFYAPNWALLEFLFGDPHSENYQPVLEPEVAEHYGIDFSKIQHQIEKIKHTGLLDYRNEKEQKSNRIEKHLSKEKEKFIKNYLKNYSEVNNWQGIPYKNTTQLFSEGHQRDNIGTPVRQHRDTSETTYGHQCPLYYIVKDYKVKDSLVNHYSSYPEEEERFLEASKEILKKERKDISLEKNNTIDSLEYNKKEFPLEKNNKRISLENNKREFLLESFEKNQTAQVTSIAPTGARPVLEPKPQDLDFDSIGLIQHKELEESELEKDLEIYPKFLTSLSEHSDISSLCKASGLREDNVTKLLDAMTKSKKAKYSKEEQQEMLYSWLVSYKLSNVINSLTQVYLDFFVEKTLEYCTKKYVLQKLKNFSKSYSDDYSQIIFKDEKPFLLQCQCGARSHIDISNDGVGGVDHSKIDLENFVCLVCDNAIQDNAEKQLNIYIDSVCAVSA